MITIIREATVAQDRGGGAPILATNPSEGVNTVGEAEVTELAQAYSRGAGRDCPFISVARHKFVPDKNMYGS